MSLDSRQHKASLRRQLKALIAAMSPDQRASESLQICRRLKPQPVWQDAHAVLLYSPLAEEPDIRPLMQSARAEGKTIALPRFSAPDNCYEIAQITNPAHDLLPGHYGVLEPSPSCPSLALNQLDFTLVPGLGFSIDGRRLGRGQGHYDRLLSNVSGTTCGVAFDGQITVEVPIEAHDILLSCILTPTRWHPDVSRPRL